MTSIAGPHCFEITRLLPNSFVTFLVFGFVCNRIIHRLVAPKYLYLYSKTWREFTGAGEQRGLPAAGRAAATAAPAAAATPRRRTRR